MTYLDVSIHVLMKLSCVIQLYFSGRFVKHIFYQQWPRCCNELNTRMTLMLGLLLSQGVNEERGGVSRV